MKKKKPKTLLRIHTPGKKEKGFKKSPSYLQGYGDASKLVSLGMSIWGLCSLSHGFGFRRKNKNESHKKLYRYCEGFMDRIEEEAKKKGIKLIYSAWNAGSPSQEDIGK